MKSLFVFCAVVGAIVYSPRFIENAPSNCGAVVAKAVSFNAKAGAEANNVFARGIMNEFAAPIVEGMIAASYPNYPTSVTCASMYWQMTFDPAMRAKISAAVNKS